MWGNHKPVVYNIRYVSMFSRLWIRKILAVQPRSLISWEKVSSLNMWTLLHTIQPSVGPASWGSGGRIAQLALITASNVSGGLRGPWSVTWSITWYVGLEALEGLIVTQNWLAVCADLKTQLLEEAPPTSTIFIRVWALCFNWVSA